VSEYNIAIIGASGYTGGELLRLFYFHKNVTVSYITSRKHKGKKVGEVFSALGNFYPDLEFSSISAVPDNIDYFFLALPHSVSMLHVRRFLEIGKVIDLGADFRIKDIDKYEKWYGMHHEKDLVNNAVFGLPEIYRDDIRNAKLIANPGCYPTSVILGAYPFYKENLINGEIIVDSKSGVSGAGRNPKENLHFPEVDSNFYAYSVNGHRHQLEMEQELKAEIVFTPHLLPVERGILSSIYIRTSKSLSNKQVEEIFKKYYSKEFFIRLSGNKSPALKDVRGSNFVNIGWSVTGNLVKIFVVIDNLVKGASGQAIQNFNLMAGFPENTAIDNLPLFP